MFYPNSLALITTRLHQLSSIAKLFIIGIFWLVVSFGQNFFPNLVFTNQITLSVVITIAFVTNLVTEIIIYTQKRSNKEFQSILSLQIIFNTLFLLTFLILIDHINGPLFLICTLTLMESSLNLNLTIPSFIVVITGTFTIVEWALLVFAGQLTPDLINIAALFLRIIILIVLMGYSRSLAEAIIAAHEVDKLKDEFISITSHELRTPMTSVKAYLWMALSGRGGELKPKQRYYLQRSYNSSNRLIKLVNDMLNISRIESGHISLKVEKVQMEDLVKEVVVEFSSHAKLLGVTIKTNSANPSAEVIADADKIKEVLLNLIGNSLKYTPKNGTVTIDFKTDHDSLTTKVSDTGLGMNTQIINNLFQKFGFIRGSYQTNHSSNTGTGLGLYICKQIITLHHGKIWGSSRDLGKGSTFSFSLPLYTPSRLKYFQKQYQHSSKVGIIHSKI